MNNLTQASNLSNLTQESLSVYGVNKSALVSTMASELFHHGLNERVALFTAVAFVGSLDYAEDMDDFMEALVDGLEGTEIEIKGYTVEDDLDTSLISQALVDAKYLTNEGIGPRMGELISLRTEAYLPPLASDGIDRRFGYTKVKHSKLFVEAIHALESTEYTVDNHMLSVALKVQAQLGEDQDQEGYVLRGCQRMDSELAYVSEFKGDSRGRMYQASCHGPNGQASDRSRALMNLVGVPTDYDIEEVMAVIKDELHDMCSGLRAAVEDLKELGEVKFVIKYLDSVVVTKPWSFIKAVRIMRELQAGNRPYIGMGVGLDAKCSGPQLGALLVGDQQIAAACGMTLEEVEDAYQIAVQHLEKVGLCGFTRDGIKKSYMGIFYGQGYMAFTDREQLLSDGQHEVVSLLYGTGPANDDTAKAFHKAITSSFGPKMVGVRQMFKSYSSITKGRTKHTLPDGFEVAMNYKVKVNVLGEVMEYDTETPDVYLRNNAEFYKFINFQMKTLHVHEGDFARNGFVNMIQGVDGLLARLIVVYANRLGATHIICVHDCLRVNVTQMGILKEAIKLAYLALFGSEYNEATADLPMGTDILSLYFQGANKQLLEGEAPKMISQFFSSGKRRMRKINGVKVVELIESLGESYYFAK